MANPKSIGYPSYFHHMSHQMAMRGGIVTMELEASSSIRRMMVGHVASDWVQEINSV